MLLKRITPQNIVIGGAAGSIPPAVGWAAVTGNILDPAPLFLFLIVFFWTPPHFWALAIHRKDDYEKEDIAYGVYIFNSICTGIASNRIKKG